MNWNKIKAFMIVAGTSILFSAVVSGIVGLCFWLANMGFWAAFGITFIIQVFIGGLINKYQDRKIITTLANIEAQNNLINSLQQTMLNCAYCQTPNQVDIFIGKENTFKCASCNEINKIELTFSTMRITSAIQPNKVISDIFAKIDELNSQEHIKKDNSEKIGVESSKN